MNIPRLRTVGMLLERHPLVALTSVFLLSRIAYAALGLTFDAGTLPRYWQFIDPDLLKHDLWRSVWYSHAQPPLYNLFLGVVLRLGGTRYVGAFQAASITCGFVMTLCFYRLLRQVGRSVAISLGTTLLVMLNPATLLFESWLYVDYFVAAALVVAALFLVRFRETGQLGQLVCAMTMLSLVVLSRSMFHIVWLVLIVGGCLVSQPRPRTKVAIIGAIALCLCGSVYVKNYALVKSASASSCVGISVNRVTVAQLNDDRVRELIEHRVLSKFAAANPFFLPAPFPEEFRAPHRGVPLLDRPTKSNGSPNFNQLDFPRICRQYQSDGIAAARHQPVILVDAARIAGLTFFRPSTDYQHFAGANRERLRPISRLYAIAVLGQIREPVLPPQGFDLRHTPRRLLEVGWTLVIAYCLVFALGFRSLLRSIREHGLSSPVVALLGFCLVTITYVMLVGNLLESGENNRIRFLLDPLVVVTLGAIFSGSRHAIVAPLGITTPPTR